MRSAYANWDKVKAFDDQNSLLQHLSCLGTHMDPSDFQKPDFPGGDHENVAASEMVAESSSRRSNVCTSTRTSLFGEDFGYFRTCSDDIDRIYEAAMQLQHAWPCSPVYFEGVDDQKIHGSGMEIDGINAGGVKVV